MTPREAVPFRLSTCTEGAAAVVSVRGELDIASASALREELLRLAGDELPDLVVDGSGLTFVDSTGLAVLMMASRRWESGGKRVVLRGPSRALTRLLDLTGVRRAFEVE